MKKKINKVLSVILVLTMLLALGSIQTFAQDVDNEINSLTKWLSDIENTEFDFTGTSYLDTDVCWTVLALAKSGKTDAYAQFENYINSVVSENNASMYAANFALIYITAQAYGLDCENIGGCDIYEKLTQTDYSSQTYLSSLYYPLIALNYKETPEYSGVRKTIVDTIISAQQSDGGFPYCSVDQGWGISSDVDTTSFVVQSLADYKDIPEIKAVIDNALEYIETQKFSDGSYGYTAYNSPSAESTAQAIIAKLALGLECNDSVSALKTYINASTGAAKDYLGNDNTMTSYQTLLALIDVKDVANGGKGIYKYQQSVEETTTEENSTEVTDDKENTTEENGIDAEITTSNSNKVDIPKTGGKSFVCSFCALTVMGAGAFYCMRKKYED